MHCIVQFNPCDSLSRTRHGSLQMLLSEKRFNHYRKRLQENTAPLKKPVLAAYLRPGAPLARRAGGTARGRRYQRRGHRTLAKPVSVLRRSHDNHRDIPARLLAALQSRSVPRRDQDRHITIRSGSISTSQCCTSAALALHACPRVALDSRRPLRDAGSACRDRPTGFVAPSIASQTSRATRQQTASVEIRGNRRH